MLVVVVAAEAQQSVSVGAGWPISRGAGQPAQKESFRNEQVTGITQETFSRLRTMVTSPGQAQRKSNRKSGRSGQNASFSVNSLITFVFSINDSFCLITRINSEFVIGRSMLNLEQKDGTEKADYGTGGQSLGTEKEDC
jgi:hypothetical protein